MLTTQISVSSLTRADARFCPRPPARRCLPPPQKQLLGQPLEVCLELIHGAGDLLTEQTFFAAIAEVETTVKSIRLLLDRGPS